MARAKSKHSVSVEGENGYALELHAMDDNTVQAVIVGIKTGKRHANVTINPWGGEFESAVHWANLLIEEPEELDAEMASISDHTHCLHEVVAQPKAEYL